MLWLKLRLSFTLLEGADEGRFAEGNYIGTQIIIYAVIIIFLYQCFIIASFFKWSNFISYFS